MIHLQQASLHFGSTTALAHCDLAISKGEHVALIGPSGSGKSSLLKVLSTEHALSSGSYTLNGGSIEHISPKALKQARCHIASIPQHLALVPNIKVSQNVLLGKIGSRSVLSTVLTQLFPSKTELSNVLQTLSEVGIAEKMFHRTDSLSGGQQQRVAIARAIYQQASLCLADEPVSAVDPSRAHALLELLTTLARQHKLTLVCSLHNLEYAKAFFPRLIGLRHGEIVFDGRSEDFSSADFQSLYQLEDND